MTSLFIIEKAIGGDIISLSRTLTFADLDIHPVQSEKAVVDSSLYQTAYVGEAISLKMEYIKELQAALGIKLKGGSYTNSSHKLNGITDNWDGESAHAYNAMAKQSVKYTGFRTEASKINRFNEALDAARTDFNDNKYDLRSDKLKIIEANIQRQCNANNTRIEDAMRKVFVELDGNQEFLESTLSDNDKATLSTNNERESALLAQIKALQDDLEGVKTHSYEIKRNAITQTAEKQLGEKGKEILAQLKDEKPTTHDYFNLF